MKIRIVPTALAGMLLATPLLAQQASNPIPPVVSAPPVTVSPDDAAKRAVATRYLATQDDDANFERLLTMLSASMRNPDITAQQRADFVEYARTHLDRTMLKNGLIDAMMQTYTLPELKALADFYGSPIGKKIAAKSKDFQTAANQAVLPAALMFLTIYAAQCTDKSKCIDLSAMAKK